MTDVLFCMKDSTYKDYDTNIYDEQRNALTWSGKCPAIHHPPCRTWTQFGMLFTKADTRERFLARWSVEMIANYGGVMEHPINSKIWKHCRNGFLMRINQGWFGHPCKKPTGLYIVGMKQSELPYFEMINKHYNTIENNSKKWRSKTPPQLSEYLIKICDQIKNKI